MNKKIIIIIVVVLVIIALTLRSQLNFSKPSEIKTEKQAIYDIFNNFPKSNMIYYITQNKYTPFSVGPTIYQIYILAELTDDTYNAFINQIEFEKLDNFEIKINPKNIKYNWKKIKNVNIIESKDEEVASIQSIYLDENTKTIYIIAIGGN